MRRTPLALLTVTLGLLAACSDTGSSPPPPPTATPESSAPAASSTAVTPTVPPPSPGCNSTPQTGPDHFTDQVQLHTQSDGLQIGDFKVGCGALVSAGVTATVQYTGWLQSDGTKFDSSRDRGQPFPVTNVGQAGVIQGWNEGLIGMRAGGKRRLVIPPALGYGAQGQGSTIPPNATLVFDIEVIAVT